MPDALPGLGRPGSSAGLGIVGQPGQLAAGRNPNGRGKSGARLHPLTDAAGVLLPARIAPASRHDATMFEAMLAVGPPVRTPTGRRRKRPGQRHADKRRHSLRRRDARRRHVKLPIAHGGVERSDCLGRHRWALERMLARLKRYRRLAARHERREDARHAFPALACRPVCRRCLDRL